MSFGFPVQQTFASSTPATIVEKVEDVSPYAASRHVVHTVIFSGKVIPPNKYAYKDSLGYQGNILLSSYYYDLKVNRTIATYAGTVYCQGTCVGPSGVGK